jgi:hypothetical protein
LNKTLYPTLVKVTIGLSKPLLNSRNDCIGIGEAQEIITQGLESLQKVSTGLQSLLLTILCKHAWNPSGTQFPTAKFSQDCAKGVKAYYHSCNQFLGRDALVLRSQLIHLLLFLFCHCSARAQCSLLLTQDHKHQRLQACTNLLEQYESLGDYFLGFPDANAIIAAVKKWLTQADDNFYESGIQGLLQRWRTCIECGGDYVEK